MSYSFSVKAQKSDIVAKVDEQLHDVVATQPAHSNDVEIAKEAVESIMSLVEDGTYNCSVSGSLSWQAEGQFVGAALSVNVYRASE